MRLFIALTLPPDAVSALTEVQMRLPVGRPVAEDNLHLTLAFLGDQPPEAAEALDEALDGLRAPAISLSLAGAAVFGGTRGQAVGLEADGGKALGDLHTRVLARCRGAGIAPERRRFRPHVTLVRLRGRANAQAALPPLLDARLGPFACHGFALMQSTLHRDGALYDTLAAYPLEAR